MMRLGSLLVLHSMLAIWLIGPAVTQAVGTKYLGEALPSSGLPIPTQVSLPARLLGNQVPFRMGSEDEVNRIQSDHRKWAINDGNDLTLDWVRCAMGYNTSGSKHFNIDQIIAMRKAAFNGDRFLLCFLLHGGQFPWSQERHWRKHHISSSEHKHHNQRHHKHQLEGKQKGHSRAEPNQDGTLPGIKPLKQRNRKGPGRHQHRSLAMQRKVFSMKHAY